MGEEGEKHWAIRANAQGGKIKLAIEDSGNGIAPKLVRHVFAPFFTTKKDRGTGLGLPIARRIVEAHSAEINLESLPGQGTTVTLLWPSCNSG